VRQKSIGKRKNKKQADALANRYDWAEFGRIEVVSFIKFKNPNWNSIGIFYIFF
jgi:hypothetical protein